MAMLAGSKSRAVASGRSTPTIDDGLSHNASLAHPTPSGTAGRRGSSTALQSYRQIRSGAIAVLLDADGQRRHSVPSIHGYLAREVPYNARTISNPLELGGLQ